MSVRVSPAHTFDIVWPARACNGADTGGKLMAERSAVEGGASEQRDLHGFCTKIQRMVEMARDEPSFFDKVGECIGVICQVRVCVTCVSRVLCHVCVCA